MHEENFRHFLLFGEVRRTGLGTTLWRPLPCYVGPSGRDLSRAPARASHFRAEEAMGEAHLPAEHPQASEEPRLSAPHVDKGRSGRAEGEAVEGPAPAVGPTGRIRDRGTFARLRASGSRTSSGPITVTFVHDEVATPPRVAYSVGRRVGSAVVRNRIRRRLRAIVATVAAQLAPGAYLISAGPRAAEMSFADLRSAVNGALDRMTAAANRTGERP